MRCASGKKKTLTPALGQNGMSVSITKGKHDVHPLSTDTVARAIGALKQKYDLAYTTDWLRFFETALRIIEAALKFVDILEKLARF